MRRTQTRMTLRQALVAVAAVCVAAQINQRLSFHQQATIGIAPIHMTQCFIPIRVDAVKHMPHTDSQVSLQHLLPAHLLDSGSDETESLRHQSKASASPAAPIENEELQRLASSKRGELFSQLEAIAHQRQKSQKNTDNTVSGANHHDSDSPSSPAAAVDKQKQQIQIPNTQTIAKPQTGTKGRISRSVFDRAIAQVQQANRQSRSAAVATATASTPISTPASSPASIAGAHLRTRNAITSSSPSISPPVSRSPLHATSSSPAVITNAASAKRAKLARLAMIPCRYEMSPNGCPKGDACPCAHVQRDNKEMSPLKNKPQVLTIPVSVASVSGKSRVTSSHSHYIQQQCKYEFSPEGCYKGDRCPYLHTSSAAGNKGLNTDDKKATVAIGNAAAVAAASSSPIESSTRGGRGGRGGGIVRSTWPKYKTACKYEHTAQGCPKGARLCLYRHDSDEEQSIGKGKNSDAATQHSKNSDDDNHQSQRRRHSSHQVMHKSSNDGATTTTLLIKRPASRFVLHPLAQQQQEAIATGDTRAASQNGNTLVVEWRTRALPSSSIKNDDRRPVIVTKRSIPTTQTRAVAAAPFIAPASPESRSHSKSRSVASSDRSKSPSSVASTHDSDASSLDDDYDDDHDFAHRNSRHKHRAIVRQEAHELAQYHLQSAHIVQKQSESGVASTSHSPSQHDDAAVASSPHHHHQQQQPEAHLSAPQSPFAATVTLSAASPPVTPFGTRPLSPGPQVSEQELHHILAAPQHGAVSNHRTAAVASSAPQRHASSTSSSDQLQFDDLHSHSTHSPVAQSSPAGSHSGYNVASHPLASSSPPRAASSPRTTRQRFPYSLPDTEAFNLLAIAAPAHSTLHAHVPVPSSNTLAHDSAMAHYEFQDLQRHLAHIHQSVDALHRYLEPTMQRIRESPVAPAEGQSALSAYASASYNPHDYPLLLRDTQSFERHADSVIHELSALLHKPSEAQHQHQKLFDATTRSWSLEPQQVDRLGQFYHAPLAALHQELHAMLARITPMREACRVDAKQIRYEFDYLEFLASNQAKLMAVNQQQHQVQQQHRHSLAVPLPHSRL